MKKVFVFVNLFVLFHCISYAQTGYNLDFEDSCDSSETRLCGWDVSWKSEGVKISASLKDGNQSLLISSKGGVGFVEQRIDFPKSGEYRILTVSGKIRVENIDGKGAGLNIALYDTSASLVYNEDMGYGSFGWVSGTQEWKEYKLKTICPPNIMFVKIGAILYGKGNALLDDFKVELTSIEGRESNENAKEYIDYVSNIIAENSIMKDSVDIKKLKSTALKIAGDKNDYSDYHLAVSYLLSGLEDHHSFLLTPEIAKSWKGEGVEEEEQEIEYAKHKIIENCGYISVPYFNGNIEKLKIGFADTIQSAIRELSSSGIKGWIIDLRGNKGGNMEPMIAGLGPLFDSEKLGYLVDVNGGKEAWFYKNGAYYWESGTGEREDGISASDPVVLSDRLPVAVLIGSQTGSSGEIVVISFIGNGNTKLFGEPTWGLTTGNSNFDLPDGAMIFLAATVMADRNGKLYYGQIEPDEKIKKSENAGEDAEIRAAIEWIKSMD